ncbi:1-deoxy-D-xylulose-5-phosphate synthase [Clostridium sp. SHJSY1]|uniref:1-deoxy-D-xylulose-5-phosphate synthase n=1 Tax=Clostridium sp. SHJSY1 TaxID=2942483 RepID=UPI002874C175|nr:1-deoxy-D-xylulose-5-phosphate synthase [Clostridium sp. SHJSY1]MDS0527870.1 1-deoxy-D-xylulose-5-phosphate synthase [Clostridium sp. SHJSY1]
MDNILESIKFPGDVKNLNTKELENLGEEIRKFLIEKVSKTGGHLASNLGVVDLTLSLFKTFDLEKDKFIWDVGHQSYVHKILTGRKEQFDVLRKKDGMSGFPKRIESKYDSFDTGHSSTSISAALGMARARDLKGEDHEVVAIIGDGALTGGMAFEALNDVGFNKTDMIIILNDNQMSISKNVGGMSSYLRKLRMEPGYNKLKNDINNTLSTSKLGKSVVSSLSKIKDSIKQLVVPSMLFEDMGIKYLGPIDGHDIKSMIEVFNKAKEIKGPVIIHTITKKGKGYEKAEISPEKYHGVSPFDLESGEPYGSPKNSYSKAFGKAIINLAKEDKDIVAITAAMPDGTGLKCFAKEFPERIFDVGIAEQHAVTLAAGMACSGLKPVFAVYSTFLQRAYDQVLHDVCIQDLPVVLCLDRAGIVGDDGETHQGIMDISYLSMMPNMTIVAPKCLSEVECILKWAINKQTPVAIRYPRGGDSIEGLKPCEEITLGKWEVLNNGEKLAIIATGKMVQHVLKAKEILDKRGVNVTIINATFIKPLDEEILKKLSRENYNIISVEDNIKKGGFGSLVLEVLVREGYKGKFKNLGYNDEFIKQGNVDILYKENGLDPESIAKEALELI